jgi:hypothetical protein
MEHYRWLPPTIRTYFAAIYKILEGKSFEGTLSFKPHPNYTPPQLKAMNYTDYSTLPIDRLRPGWRKIEGRFTMVTGLNVPRGSKDTIFAPGAARDDGSIDVMVIMGTVSRLELIGVFLNLETGTHIHWNCVRLFKVSELYLEPREAGSHLDASGIPMKVQHNSKIREREKKKNDRNSRCGIFFFNLNTVRADLFESLRESWTVHLLKKENRKKKGRKKLKKAMEKLSSHSRCTLFFWLMKFFFSQVSSFRILSNKKNIKRTQQFDFEKRKKRH